MPIVAAAVVPHNPTLLPSVAKAHHQFFRTTPAALSQINEELHAAQVETIIVVTPHGPVDEGPCVLHVHERYQGMLNEFGDVHSRLERRSDAGLTAAIQRAAAEHHAPMQLRTYDHLDYGTTVPLLALPASEQRRLLPLHVNTQAVAPLVQCGIALHDALSTSPVRTMLIASVDCTRRQERSPDTLRRPTAEERRFSQAITNIDPTIITSEPANPTTCGYAPLVVALHALQPLATQGSILSFEAPLGVGLLTALVQLAR